MCEQSRVCVYVFKLASNLLIEVAIHVKILHYKTKAPQRICIVVAQKHEYLYIDWQPKIETVSWNTNDRSIDV